MRCVVDTSAVSWLGRIERLDLFREIYKTIYAPERVLEELEPHKSTKEFVSRNIIPITFNSEKEQRRFYSLVRRWSKKVSLEDIADIQVFIGYKFFTDADEALYANKEAEAKLSRYGNVRDIYSLYELAEERRIFTRKDSISYLESLLTLEPPYQPKII